MDVTMFGTSILRDADFTLQLATTIWERLLDLVLSIDVSDFPERLPHLVKEIVVVWEVSATARGWAAHTTDGSVWVVKLGLPSDYKATDLVWLIAHEFSHVILGADTPDNEEDLDSLEEVCDKLTSTIMDEIARCQYQ